MDVGLIVKNVSRIKNEITISVGMSVKIQKEHRACKKICIWNPATRSCKNVKYVGSNVDDSVVTCD